MNTNSESWRRGVVSWLDNLEKENTYTCPFTGSTLTVNSNDKPLSPKATKIRNWMMENNAPLQLVVEMKASISLGGASLTVGSSDQVNSALNMIAERVNDDPKVWSTRIQMKSNSRYIWDARIPKTENMSGDDHDHDHNIVLASLGL